MNSIFNQDEQDLIDAARLILADGVRRLSQRDNLFPLPGMSRNDRQALSDARSAFVSHLVAEYGPLRHEIAVAALIDAQGRLITVNEFPHGKESHVEIDYRRLAGWICETGAVAVVLAHNHPSGECSPSKADIDLTHALKSWLRPLRCALLDHFVITGEGAASITGGFE